MTCLAVQTALRTKALANQPSTRSSRDQRDGGGGGTTTLDFGFTHSVPCSPGSDAVKALQVRLTIGLEEDRSLLGALRRSLPALCPSPCPAHEFVSPARFPDFAARPRHQGRVRLGRVLRAQVARQERRRARRARRRGSRARRGLSQPRGDAQGGARPCQPAADAGGVWRSRGRRDGLDQRERASRFGSYSGSPHPDPSHSPAPYTAERALRVDRLHAGEPALPRAAAPHQVPRRRLRRHPHRRGRAHGVRCAHGRRRRRRRVGRGRRARPGRWHAAAHEAAAQDGAEARLQLLTDDHRRRAEARAAQAGAQGARAGERRLLCAQGARAAHAGARARTGLRQPAAALAGRQARRLGRHGAHAYQARLGVTQGVRLSHRLPCRL